MPLMTKIRESMTKVFAIFAGLFVVYIVLDWGMDLTGRRSRGQGASQQVVGTIDGQDISYKDFTEQVKQATDNQKQQTGQEPDENMQKSIRDQVWNQYIDE